MNFLKNWYSANLTLLDNKLHDGLDCPSYIFAFSECLLWYLAHSTYLPSVALLKIATIPQYIYLPVHIESVFTFVDE